MNKEQAFNCGVNYAENGANEINCNFGIFSKSELTKAWEEGRDSITKKFLFVLNSETEEGQ